MDHGLLAAEILQQLRGKRARAALARRLGFRSNVLYTWEQGLRAPTASDFLRLAALRNVAVRVPLARFCERADDWLDEPLSEPELVARVLTELRGERTISQLAAAADATRLTVTRWLAGDTQPRLPDLLRFIDGATQRLLEFVALFADPAQLSTTRGAWADLQAQLRVAYELPWSHAVLRGLELASYRQLPQHDAGLLAGLLGIETQEVDRCLEALERARQIQWDGCHWLVSRVLAVDTGRDRRGDRLLKAHWAQVGLDRLRGSEAPEGFFSYNLFAISDARYQRIRELHAAYYNQLRAIIAEEDAPDRVVLTNLQLFSLQDSPERPCPPSG